jgi:hypothetical protein
MSPLQQRISIFTDARLAVIAGTAANLKAQLFELERLREEVGKAVLSAEKSRPTRRGFLAPTLKVDPKIVDLFPRPELCGRLGRATAQGES